MRPVVLMYRDQLLPFSETFISTQVSHLKAYQGVYVGTSRLNQIPVDCQSSLCLSDFTAVPALWKTALKLGQIIHPGWLRSMQQVSPVLLHAHFGLDALWARILARRLGLPLVITFRGSDVTGMQASRPGHPAQLVDLVYQRGQFFRDYYLDQRPSLWNDAAQCLTVSQFLRGQLLALGCPEAKIEVVYNGVDLTFFNPNPAILREPLVLFVGRLVEKKGCEYLIRAMAMVQAQLPETRLVVIGDGPLRSPLTSLAQTLGVSVQFLGIQSHPTVRDWMNRAKLLVAPSVTAANGDTEGLPNVVTEAMAMALPVVSTTHAGIPELVVHGHTGLLGPERDSERLAKHIVALLLNEPRWQAFSMAARQRVETHFDLNQSIQRLEGVYTHILNPGP